MQSHLCLTAEVAGDAAYPVIPTTEPARCSMERHHGFFMIVMGVKSHKSEDEVVNSVIHASVLAMFRSFGLVQTIELAPNMVIQRHLSKTAFSAEFPEHHSERQ